MNVQTNVSTPEPSGTKVSVSGARPLQRGCPVDVSSVEQPTTLKAPRNSGGPSSGAPTSGIPRSNGAAASASPPLSPQPADDNAASTSTKARDARLIALPAYHP